MTTHRRWSAFAMAFTAVVCFSSQGFASMTPQSIDELTANSSHIVRGQVLSVEAKWNDAGTTIYTEVNVQIAETYKTSGAVPTTVMIMVPGGTVGETRLWVEHTPDFEVGQDVVTFLIDRGPFYDVTSWVQGKYTVINKTVSELGFTAEHFVSQINEVVAAERKRNGEK